jgi:hypothetical protein
MAIFFSLDIFSENVFVNFLLLLAVVRTLLGCSCHRIHHQCGKCKMRKLYPSSMQKLYNHRRDSETKVHAEITFKGLFGRKQINWHLGIFWVKQFETFRG